MSVSIHIAKVAGTQLQTSATRTEYVLPGWADNVDVAGSPDVEVLIQLLSDASFPRLGSALSATYPNLKLTNVRMLASSTKYRRVDFDLIYSANSTDSVVGASIIRDRSQVVQVTTDRVGDHWIVLQYKKPFDEPVKPDTQLVEVLVPARTLEVTRVVAGKPEESSRNNIGMVNNATWCGLPKGYWMVNSVGSDLVRYQGYYTYTLSAASKVHEDWSQVLKLWNKENGKYVDVSDEVLAALMAVDYAYGLTYPATDDATDVAGAARLGYYKLADFTTLFGFDSQPSASAFTDIFAGA